MAIAVNDHAHQAHGEVDLRRHGVPVAVLLESEQMRADPLAVAMGDKPQRTAIGKGIGPGGAGKEGRARREEEGSA